MTRLTELLIPILVLASTWSLLITGIVPIPLPSSCWMVVQCLPAYFIIAFGCYALASVGYSVYNVKSDDAAADLLQQDIQSAKLDFEQKGFLFSS